MMKKLQNEDSGSLENEKSLHAACIDDALKVAGFGKYNYGLVIVCSWTLQAMGMDLFGISFVVAAAVCDLELTLQERALLTATPLIGVVIGAQFWGYIADTKGRRLTLVLSMSIGFVFAALSSLAPDWKSMAVLKLFSSIFTSASNSAAYTLLGESCSPRVRGKAMLLCSCALMCSQAMVAAIAYPILPLQFSYWIEVLGINYRSWRLLAFVISLPCLITACLLQLFYESPKFLLSRGKYEDSIDVLRKIYVCNTGGVAVNFPVKKLILDIENRSVDVEGNFFQALWRQTLPLFRAPLLKETLKLFYLVIIIYMTGSGFILWLPYIMNNLFSVLEVGEGEGMNLCTVIRQATDDSFSTGNITSTEKCNDIVQNTTLISAIIYGALASFVSLILSLTCESRKRKAMMFMLSSSALSAILLNVVAVPIAGGFLFFLFLLCAVSMGILSVYFVELYPTFLRGTVSCLSVMLGRSSAFVGVNIIGALISTNCETTFYAWSLLLLSGVAVAWFLPRNKQNRTISSDK